MFAHSPANRPNTTEMRLRWVSLEALREILNEIVEWKPETANQVRERVTEIVGLTDQDALDLLRSRAVQQDVLDILDEPAVW